MVALITNGLKSTKKCAKKVINSLDLRIVSNSLISPTIICAGIQDAGYEMPITDIATGLDSCVFYE